ncbi:MAG TPA: inositol monophosphatase family protein [Planctomycetota bacterium]|nr:inositol monophosphatase family protein [Planctomycetota bacterium]
MSQPTLKEILAVATEAAYLGGRRTLAYFGTQLAVETKHDDSPVTQADKEAEAVIRGVISKYYPRHSIVGEEGGTSEGDPDYRWIVDPIDGTKTFIHGVPFYGVLIGVEVRGSTDVGVVYLPAFDELVVAARGLGCLWNGRPAKVSGVSELKHATLLTTNISTAVARSDAYEKLAAQAKMNRTWGDCYGYVLVATGRAEIMMDPEMKPWDSAPLLPILQEAGGHFTTWDGRATIWGPDGVATNAALHQQVAAVLKAEKRK